jgi:tetratricopeptide (TPR) repeat protein
VARTGVTERRRVVTARGSARVGQAAVVALVVSVAAARATGKTDSIAELSALIAQRPDNGALQLRRASFSRDRGDFESALADLELAASMPATAVEACTRAGHLLFDLRRFAEAVVRFDAALALEPADPRLAQMKARALWAMGRRREATAVFEALMAAATPPEPALYCHYATLLADSPPARVTQAIAVLDRGMQRLGPTAGLAALAADLEIRRRRWNRAIAYLDRLITQVERKDPWLRRKGDVLVMAARPCAARDAYRAAIAAIAALAPDVQRTPMFTTARTELATQLKRHDIASLPRPARRGEGPSHGRPLSRRADAPTSPRWRGAR